MAFISNGDVHRIGVNNEIDVVAKLNNELNNNVFRNIIIDMCDKSKIGDTFSFIHAGGTQSKADVVLISDYNSLLNVTVKHHKTGTWDYINTSKLSNYLDKDIVDSLNNTISKIKKDSLLKIEHGISKDVVVKECRNLVENVINSVFNSFTGEDIKTLLNNIVALDPELCVISNKSSAENIVIRKVDRSDFIKYKNVASDSISLFTKKAKTSRTILFNGEKSGLRIRVVLNNGINALLGLSDKNKSSILCIKIQNDNPKSIFKDKIYTIK